MSELQDMSAFEGLVPMPPQGGHLPGPKEPQQQSLIAEGAHVPPEVTNQLKESIEHDAEDSQLDDRETETVRETSETSDQRSASVETEEEEEEDNEASETSEQEELGEQVADQVEEEVARALFGDLEVPLDVPHKWSTKAGDEFEATLQELRNDYCGKQELSRRFSEFDLRQKEFEEQLARGTQFETFEKEVSSLQGDDLLLKVLETANQMNPQLEQAFEAYYNKVFNEASKVLQMTPHERDLYEAQKKAAFYEKKEQERATRSAEVKKQEFINSRVEGIKGSWKVDNELIDSVYNLSLQRGWISETDPIDKILDTVESKVARYVFEDKAEAVLKKVAPELANNDECISDLASWQERNPNKGRKDLEARAKKLFGQEQKPEKRPVNKPKKRTKPKKQNNEMTILRGNDDIWNHLLSD